ncbi:hypothetical protein DFH09DRAFT_1386296, partial [Mycena vulgaris]
MLVVPAYLRRRRRVNPTETIAAALPALMYLNASISELLLERLSPCCLPPLPWAANGGALTWTLLACLQEKENFSVLFGKQDPKENTSSDHKITVYERIAQKMFPEDFKTHAKMLGRRVKGKTEDLCKIYKEKAARLRVTGGGVGAPEDSGADGGHQYLDYYIPEDGPHHDTPVAAVNLWEQLNQEFPYFSELHKFLSTRPNVVPPLITTGIGPQGRKIVHNQTLVPTSQRFDESVIDPVLLNLTATPPSRYSSQLDVHPADDSPLRLISTNRRLESLQTPQTGGKPGIAPKSIKGPKTSTFGGNLTNAMDKARHALKHIPKKRSLEDVIMESSRENLEIARERAVAQAEHRRQNLILSQKNQIMEMFKLGIKTLEEARAEIALLDAPPKASMSRRSPRRS